MSANFDKQSNLTIKNINQIMARYSTKNTDYISVHV